MTCRPDQLGLNLWQAGQVLLTSLRSPHIMTCRLDLLGLICDRLGRFSSHPWGVPPIMTCRPDMLGLNLWQAGQVLLTSLRSPPIMTCRPDQLGLNLWQAGQVLLTSLRSPPIMTCRLDLLGLICDRLGRFSSHPWGVPPYHDPLAWLNGVCSPGLTNISPQNFATNYFGGGRGWRENLLHFDPNHKYDGIWDFEVSGFGGTSLINDSTHIGKRAKKKRLFATCKILPVSPI
jgi:hypothetical protein